MSIYRVVCSQTPKDNGYNTIIDFAIADEGKASLTHLQLFKIRKYETAQAEWIMPPIFIEEKNGKSSVYFDKPENATDEQNKKLKELTPLIKCELTKLKHYGLENSLEMTDRNISFIYNDVNPYQIPTNETEARLFERIQRSIRINQQLSAKKTKVDPLIKYFLPEY